MELDSTKRWESGPLPRHVAIIMDGNGRWAKKRLMPRQMGHRAGIEALRRTIEAAIQTGIPILTVYAFSTENWSRPLDEVNHLMNLLLEYLTTELETLHEKNIKLNIWGDTNRLSPRIQQELKLSCAKTAGNDAMNLNIALNYGGRMEIVAAARKIAEEAINGVISLEQINEEYFAEHLYTSRMPDPDLLIRTAGELRISNFLLWQLAYTEIWVTDVLWPDFNREILDQAVADYQKRVRKYGTVGAV